MMYGSPEHAKNEIEGLVGPASMEHCTHVRWFKDRFG